MIGVVVVSHSAALARGVAELARQMAPDIAIGVAGGTEDGGIGTSLDRVTAALDEADQGDGAVVLTDLGSATMTAEMALELLCDERRERVALVDAPLVEGVVAAATTAQGGADLGAVVDAAEQAGGGREGPAPAAGPSVSAREVILADRLGLHARPASTLVRGLKGLDARLTVTRTDTGASADGRSVLALVGLAAPGGVRVRLEASGPDAQRALDAVAALIGEDSAVVVVAATVASRADAERAIEEGADEFGLVRTELAFLDRPALPDEDEQIDELTGILEAAGERPVTIRTLDVGDDQSAPALGLDPARNGPQGVRGLRWSLANATMFSVQLRAILRAARGHRVRLLLPMVTTLGEVRAARAALDAARADLDEAGTPRGDVEQVGIVVEVPAAAIAADGLVGEVDFLTVDADDLLSHLTAADPAVAEVAALRDPRAPGFLRLVGQVVAVGREAGIRVGVCGETAGDPDLATVLAGLGVTQLSVAPSVIGAVKSRLRETAR